MEVIYKKVAFHMFSLQRIPEFHDQERPWESQRRVKSCPTQRRGLTGTSVLGWEASLLPLEHSCLAYHTRFSQRDFMCECFKSISSSAGISEHPSQVKNCSLKYMEQAPIRGHEASPQSGLKVGCKLCSSSKAR